MAESSDVQDTAPGFQVGTWVEAPTLDPEGKTARLQLLRWSPRNAESGPPLSALGAKRPVGTSRACLLRASKPAAWGGNISRIFPERCVPCCRRCASSTKVVEVVELPDSRAPTQTTPTVRPEPRTPPPTPGLWPYLRLHCGCDSQPYSGEMQNSRSPATGPPYTNLSGLLASVVTAST